MSDFDFNVGVIIFGVCILCAAFVILKEVRKQL